MERFLINYLKGEDALTDLGIVQMQQNPPECE